MKKKYTVEVKLGRIARYIGKRKWREMNRERFRLNCYMNYSGNREVTANDVWLQLRHSQLSKHTKFTKTGCGCLQY